MGIQWNSIFVCQNVVNEHELNPGFRWNVDISAECSMNVDSDQWLKPLISWAKTWHRSWSVSRSCRTGVHRNALSSGPSFSLSGVPEVHLQAFWLWEDGCSTIGSLSAGPPQVIPRALGEVGSAPPRSAWAVALLCLLSPVLEWGMLVLGTCHTHVMF